MERRKKITDESIVIILSALQDLRCVRISSRPLLAEIWSLKNNFSAYDAAYVILAKNTGSTLYTHDKRLANAAKNFVSVARLDQAPAP
jgi:predicted nucleic acid-binding protein